MTDQPFVLVLAGGKGRRIGGGKPARILEGKTLLARAVALARNWSPDPVVAIRPGRDSCMTETRTIKDRDGIDGPLAGLAAGVEQAIREERELLLLLPADMPFLPGDLFARLQDALDGELDKGCAIAASAGRRHPVCSLWRVDALASHLPAYCASSSRSLRNLADQLGAIDVEWEIVDACDPFFNINDENDLRLAATLID